MKLLALLVAAALLTASCAAQPLATPVASSSGPGLTDASSGLCLTIAALPALSDAERTFTNLAHAPLHAVAAAPGLDRPLAKRVLETMERVEADFEARNATMASSDLDQLKAATDSALAALGMTVPACPS